MDAEMQRGPIHSDELRYQYSRPDFGKTSAFTGEDERFAYKRAQSRLWEMCGSRWWARSEEGWHRPLTQGGAQVGEGGCCCCHRTGRRWFCARCWDS